MTISENPGRSSLDNTALRSKLGKVRLSLGGFNARYEPEAGYRFVHSRPNGTTGSASTIASGSMSGVILAKGQICLVH